jgi:hypothetical protein
MFTYRFGRFLQVLAIIDCGVALFLGGSVSRFGMAVQFNILIFAVVLFLAGRYFQKRGEAALRRDEAISGVSSAEEPPGGEPRELCGKA